MNQFALTQLKNARTTLLLASVLIGVTTALPGLVGSRAAAAYSHNPEGVADYCSLVGGRTVLYGWAYDPDTFKGGGPNPYVSVRVGSSTQKVSTAIGTYRVSAVDSRIKKDYPGAPLTGQYGWTASFSNLYKGKNYLLSGTVINYKAGTANAVLGINTTVSITGSAARPQFTASRTIPSACLLTAPATPKPTASKPPVPTPASTPSAGPVSTPRPTNNSGTVATQATTSTSTSTAGDSSAAADTAAIDTPTVTNDSATHTVVTAGTAAAKLSIAIDGADQVSVAYGTDPNNLDNNVVADTSDGATASATLTNLNSKATYYYQVIRTNGSQTTNSSITSFTTTGYLVSLRFISKSHKPIAGIKASLGSAKATSDKDGIITFKNMSAGTYTIKFQYQGHNFSQPVNTANDAPDADTPRPTVAQKSVNLDDLLTASHRTQSPVNWLVVVMVVIAFLGVLGFALWALLFRRSGQPLSYAGGPYATGSAARHGRAQSTEPLPAHAGQSLATMVIESMRAGNTPVLPETPTTTPSPQQPHDSTTPPTVPPPLSPPPA